MSAPTAFDELLEVRQILKASEVAFAIGRTPEAVSRMRPDKPLRSDTERALDALYLAVEAVRTGTGGDGSAARWALVRRRPELAGRSILALLHDGEVERALAAAGSDERRRVPALAGERVAAFLAANPELGPVVPAVIDAVGAFLGQAAVETDVLTDEGGAAELLLVFRTPLGIVEADARMRSFEAERWDELVAPHAEKLALAIEPTA